MNGNRKATDVEYSLCLVVDDDACTFALPTDGLAEAWSESDQEE